MGRNAFRPKVNPIRRIHSEEHLIADDVPIPIAEAEREDTKKVLATLERWRAAAFAEMRANDVELADEEEDKVVIVCDFRLEDGKMVVQVVQAAE